ncbi:MAG TPA: NifB/NifX family molybdenum-iron cluster-binding protein [Syntrophales bacterium]|nr:NifB/NifX family molybdenum-iron cluster-binding protein [Syntrophales bacterium]HRT62875.1 NifB/NifX family molybdenum-iron cluster-binding protein [Syntrophales bacterium]
MKKTGLFILAAFILMTNPACAGDHGKIAVAAENKTVAADVSGVAARAPHFLIFDGSGKFLEAVDNPYRSAGGGTGTAVVSFLAQKGVTVIAAGAFGENMIRAMKNRGMGYLEFSGNAEGAAKKALESKK